MTRTSTAIRERPASPRRPSGRCSFPCLISQVDLPAGTLARAQCKRARKGLHALQVRDFGISTNDGRLRLFTSFGPRSCVGRNVAMLELQVRIVARA